jgi:hypothetical protein
VCLLDRMTDITLNYIVDDQPLLTLPVLAQFS